MTDHPLPPERIDAFRDRHIDPCSYAQEIFDAGREHERANPVDDRPWELLDGPGRVGDEVRHEWSGVTTIAVVGRVDADGDMWTAEGRLIGLRNVGTWHVRRAIPELPPERDGVVLVPADGHKVITTVDGQEFSRLTFTTKQSIWYGPNLAARLGDFIIQVASTGLLTPGTWKLEEM